MFERLKRFFGKKSFGGVDSLPAVMQDPNFKAPLKFDCRTITLIIKGPSADSLPTILDFLRHKPGFTAIFTDTDWITDGQVEIGFSLVLVDRYGKRKDYDMMRDAYRLGQILTNDKSKNYLFMIHESYPIDVVANASKVPRFADE